MRIVKTQKILYNQELRIRLISDNEDAEYLRLIRKLPGCKWSSRLNSWHTNNINDHISFLNKAFPPYIRFYDLGNSPTLPKIEEKQAERKISIRQSSNCNFLELYFLFNLKLADFLKNLGAKPSNENYNFWLLTNEPEIFKTLISYLEKANYLIKFENKNMDGNSSIAQMSLHSNYEECFREKLRSRGYKARTIEGYTYNLRRYLEWTGNHHTFSTERIKDYIDELSICRKFSRSYQNQQINSIKAFYQYVQGLKAEEIIVLRPKQNRQLPEVLEHKEFDALIAGVSNLKHKAIISTIYFTGTSLKETVSLLTVDIDIKQKQIHVSGRGNNNGGKICVPGALMEILENYQNQYHPQYYLFEGYNDSQYSARSIQKALKKYVRKTGIQKRVNVNNLRHSHALIQASGGHNDEVHQSKPRRIKRKRIEIYSKVALNENISPADQEKYSSQVNSG